MNRSITRFTYNFICIIALCTTAGCTKPKKTTAVASGVGGAIGAGLGAIVGNQTGNAGSGVAIGAAAGVVTGALIGNAIQAQEEKNTAQEERLKRQDDTIKAQKGEIAELRAMNSDSGSYNSGTSYSTTPRYRYQPTSTPRMSPEVERQIALLERRGPNPRSGSDSMVYTPPSVIKSPPQRNHEPLARYDVRTELKSDTTTKTTTTAPSRVKESLPLAESPSKAESLSKKQTSNANEISESDIAIESETASLAPAPAADSSDCKEALSEKELASKAPESSDKLFHLRRALRLCPNNASLHYELGSVYAAMERTSNAEEEFKQALTIDPSFTAAKNRLSDILKNEAKF